MNTSFIKKFFEKLFGWDTEATPMDTKIQT